MNKPSISACIITDGSDLELLVRAIDSVRSSVREILIDANGNYEEVYNLFKDDPLISVKKTIWEKDFSKARNGVIRRAIYDWILCIDSDEELLTPIEFLSDQYDAYACRYLKKLSNEMCQTHYNIKLFRNNPKYKYVNAIHELIEGPEKVSLSEIVFTETHREGLAQSKIYRNAEILLASDQPDKDFLLCQIFAGIQKTAEAIYHGEKVLADEKAPIDRKSIVAWLLSKCYEGRENKMAMLGLSIFLQPMQTVSRVELAEMCDNEKIAKQQLTEAARICKNNLSRLPLDFTYSEQFFKDKLN